MGNTYYVDFINGNDSATGTSYAQRLQTISAASSLVQPGDTVLIMQSTAPVNTGENATWSNKSATVTLSASNSLLLFGQNGHAANSCTLALDTTFFKSAVSSNNFAFLDSFTGKFGYLANSNSYSLAGYRQISFWMRVTQPLVAGQVSVCLCSDTFGNNAVYTFALPAMPVVNQWTPITIDFGSSLMGSISSVGFYMNQALSGTTNVWFDNLIACPSPGVATITHQTLIGFSNSIGAGGGDTELWYAVASINGTTVLLDQHPNASTPAYLGFYGANRTSQLWKREPILTVPTIDQTTPLIYLLNSGTPGNLITWQFGMDANSMSVQSGETWISGQSGMGVGLSIYANFNAVSGLGITRYYRGAYFHNSSGGVHNLDGISHCTADNFFLDGPSTSNTIRIHSSHHAGGSGFNDQPAGGSNNLEIDKAYSNSGYGVQIADNDLLHDGLVSNNVLAGIHTAGAIRCYRVQTAGNALAGTFGSTGDGLIGTYYTSGNFTGLSTSEVDPNIDFEWDLNPPIPGFNNHSWSAQWNGWITARFTEAYTFSALVDDGMRLWVNNILVIDNWVFQQAHTATAPQTFSMTAGQPVPIRVDYQQGPIPFAIIMLKWSSPSQSLEIIPQSAFSTQFPGGSAVHIESTQSAGYDVNFHDCLFGETTEFSGLVDFYNTRVRSHNHNQVKGSHLMITDGGQVVSESGTDRHTMSGLAWKLMPNSLRSVFYPLDYKIASLAVAANKPVVATCFFKRSDGNVTAMLLAPGGQLDGIPSDVSATSTLIGQYEQLSISFTPAEMGVVDIYARAFGGTSSAVWVDDMTVSQS